MIFLLHNLPSKNDYQCGIKANEDTYSEQQWTSLCAVVLAAELHSACSCSSLPSSCEIWALAIISCFTVASWGGDVPQSSPVGVSHTLIRLTTQTQTTTEPSVVPRSTETLLCHGANEMWGLVQMKEQSNIQPQQSTLVLSGGTFLSTKHCQQTRLTSPSSLPQIPHFATNDTVSLIATWESGH